MNSNRDVERMNTAIKLLEIIITETECVDNPKVNLRNIKRFSKLSLENSEYFMRELYFTKTWYIYNEFKRNWLFTWWD